MVKYLFSIILLFEILCANAQDSSAIIKAQDEAIEDILVNKKPPKEEKVQYISTITRYGFKSFYANNHYGYTPGLSYAAQLNPNAESFTQNYIQRFGRHLLGMKSWGRPYFNLIESIFAQYGVPSELKYLAVIESNLSPASTSWVGAAGPWQFMPYTARDYGLVVSANYDERRDYFKSTHAAAKYLLQLYKQMNHDWLLVIAAYNGGPGRVYSAIRKSGSNSFWNLQYYLPEESRNHVKKFIATHYIMEGGIGSGNFAGTNVVTGEGMDNYSTSTVYKTGAHIKNPYEINKPLLSKAELDSLEVLAVSGKYNAKTICKYVGIEQKQFNRYNPNFDATMNDIGNYDLRLPPDKMEQFKATRYEILNDCVQQLFKSKVSYDTETIYKQKYLKKKTR